MTLCALWREEHLRLYLGADSRLTFGGGRCLDVAAKVHPLQPSLRRLHRRKLDFLPRRAWGGGLAVAGSLAATQALVPPLQTAFSRLADREDSPPVTLDTLHAIITEFFESLARPVCQVLAQEGQVEFLLALQDPTNNWPHPFVYRLDASSFPIRASWLKLEESELPYFIGSGAAAAKRLREEDPAMTPLRIIRRVSLDPQVPTVGGPTQCALVAVEGFIAYGVVNLVVDEGAKTYYHQHYVNGIPIMQRPARPHLYHVEIGWLNPFGPDEDELMAAGFRRVSHPDMFRND